MKLFEKLDSILKAGCESTIVTRKLPDGRLVNIVSFRNTNVKDAAAQSIPPFTVTGTAAELDESFAFVLDVPLEKTSSLLTSMEEYEKALAIAEKNRKEEADRKAAAEKAAKAAEKKAEKKAAKSAATSADTPALDFGDDSEEEVAPAGAPAPDPDDIGDLPEDDDQND